MSASVPFPYQAHVLVCTGGRCSGTGVGEEIRKDLKARNKERGMKPHIRVCGVSCLDLCDDGPNLVVWPSGETHHHQTGESARAVYDDVVRDVEAVLTVAAKTPFTGGERP